MRTNITESKTCFFMSAYERTFLPSCVLLVQVQFSPLCSNLELLASFSIIIALIGNADATISCFSPALL